MDTPITISAAIDSYLQTIASARSLNTARAYQNGLNAFKAVLLQKKINPMVKPVTELPEDAISWLAASLKDHAPTTERLYLTAVTRFFEFLVAENLMSINLPRIRLLVLQRARRPGQRLPQFPKSSIEKVLEFIETLTIRNTPNDLEYLRNLRDRAFLITLADTGLRVHEACNLRRGDLDWNEGQAIIVGKGNRQAVVRFSKKAQVALKDYLSFRSSLDGNSGKPLSSLPLFARHDKGAGKKVKPMTATTGRNIVSLRVVEALGQDAFGSITPHSFRHYFVTRILQASGNLKLAQELARHKNIAITQRYAHLSDRELDQGYFEVFEQ